MNLSLDTQKLLDAVETSNNRKLMHRSEITYLLDTAKVRKMERVFEDIIFHAKFISHAQVVLKREGAATEQTQKLSFEFQQAIEKTFGLLNTMLLDSSQRIGFESRFLTLTPESLAQFFSLLQDLAMVKNYFLDMEQATKQ
jgi:hypothetical protein